MSKPVKIKDFLGMSREEARRLLKHIFWMMLAFGAAAIVISAVEYKESILAQEMLIGIEPLPDGNSLITEGDIAKTIDRSFGLNLVGMPLAAVDVQRLERVLEKDPFIIEAEAFIDAKARINIKVRQRQPVLRIMDNNGLNYYLDDAGAKMPLSEHFTARVLVATGNIPPHVPNFWERKRYILKDVFLVSKQLRQDPFFRALFEQLHVSNNGEITLIPKVGDHKIIIGPYEDIPEKLNKLKIFYKEGLPYEGWQKYRTINLKYQGQVVCKKK